MPPKQTKTSMSDRVVVADVARGLLQLTSSPSDKVPGASPCSMGRMFYMSYIHTRYILYIRFRRPTFVKEHDRPDIAPLLIHTNPTLVFYYRYRIVVGGWCCCEDRDNQVLHKLFSFVLGEAHGVFSSAPKPGFACLRELLTFFFMDRVHVATTTGHNFSYILPVLTTVAWNSQNKREKKEKKGCGTLNFLNNLCSSTGSVVATCTCLYFCRSTAVHICSASVALPPVTFPMAVRAFRLATSQMVDRQASPITK